MAQADIPAGITPEHFIQIRKFLLEILQDIPAEQAGMRLNVTNRQDPAPVVVGWVEGEILKNARIGKGDPDPGLYRFGDRGRPSDVYSACLNTDQKGVIQERNWNTQLSEKFEEAKAQAPKCGIKYQRFIPIMVDEGGRTRCAGTITVGFLQKPDSSIIHKADEILKSRAQDKSHITNFLKDNFRLGGRIL